MNGKEKCEILKDIRKTIADNNGIEYSPMPCENAGDCLGFCPKCEQETIEIMEALEKRQMQGDNVILDLPDTKFNGLIDEQNRNSKQSEPMCVQRRMPLFVLIDTSSEMNPIDIQNAYEFCVHMHGLLLSDPYFLETVWISVIAFNEKLTTVIPLTSVSEVLSIDSLSKLRYEKKRDLNGALYSLSDIMDRELNKTSYDRKGDWMPIVFIITSQSDFSAIQLSPLRMGFFLQRSQFQIVCLRHVTQKMPIADNTIYYSYDDDIQKVLGRMFVISGSITGSISANGIEDLLPKDLLPPPPGEVSVII